MRYEKLDLSDNFDLEVVAESEGAMTSAKLQKDRFISPAWSSLHLFGFMIFEAVALLLVLIFVSKAYAVPPTDLRYENLTPDNKSYPSGQLRWSQHFQAVPCGKSPEEALALGCRFDMLATAWLPTKCIDYELVEEFTKLGNWQFYTEMHGTTKHESYDPEHLGSLSTPRAIWTTRSWHYMHCLYMWKKIGKALVRGTLSDAETVSEPHTHHCMKAMEEIVFGPPRDPDEVIIFLEIIYPPC